MADISVEFSVVDRFSEAMNKFSEMVEKCSGGSDDLADKANKADEKLEKINKNAEKGIPSFKGFGMSMMVVNQAMQAFQRIAEPVKKALDDIAQKQRLLIMYGNEAGGAFARLAHDAAMELGRVESEIIRSGLKWQAIGVGGQNIMELVRLADRFANLNPDRSFEDIADTLRDAIKSKDIGGLSELLGGGEGVEIKLRRSGVERMLRGGNISGALNQFKNVADSFGYTQKKADEMGYTIDKKLKKIASVAGNYIRDIFSDVVARIEPYVNRILNWLQSEDVQEAMKKIRHIVGLIADAFFKVVDAVIDAVKWVYNFVYTNREIIATAAAVFGVFWAFSKLPAIITFVTTLLIKCATALTMVFSKAVYAIPIAIIGMGLAVQKLYSYITGTSVGFVETLVGIFVGGVTTIVTGIIAGAQYAWNFIVQLYEDADNFFDRVITDMCNGFIDLVEGVRNDALSIVQGMVEDIIGLLSKLADTDIGEMLGINGMAESLEKARDAIRDIKATPMERKKYDPVDYSGAKVNVISPTEISAEAIGFVMDKIEGLKNSISDSLFGGMDMDLKDIVGDLDILSGMADDLGKIRGSMQKEQDLRWMKEMAEQRFVNEVNLRQLTPTINLQVKGANSSPQEYAKALARELQQMADAGTYNAYGDVG